MGWEKRCRQHGQKEVVIKCFNYQGWKFEESFQSLKAVKFSRVLPVKTVVAKVSSMIVSLRNLLM